MLMYLLIVKAAVEKSLQHTTTLIGEDTDLLVLLLYYAQDVNKGYYFRSDKSRSHGNFSVWHQPPEGISRTRYLFLVIVYPCSNRLWLDLSNFQCWEKDCFPETSERWLWPSVLCQRIHPTARQRLLLMNSDAKQWRSSLVAMAQIP